MKKSTIILGVIGILVVVAAVNNNSSNESSSSREQTNQTNEVIQEKTPASTAQEDHQTNQIVYVDVKKIAGKSQIEVEKVLGEPVKTEKFEFEMGPEYTSYPVTLGYYLEMLEDEMGRVEIMFVDGGAQRIKINLIGDEYYKNDERYKNIGYAGLPITKLDPPLNSMQKSHYKENLFGFYQVIVADWMGNNNGNVKVITKEKYK